MRRDGQNESGRDLTEIERGLARLAPAPVPPGLRGRVIDRALEARRNAALTPRLRALTVVCATVIVAVLMSDPLIGGHEAARLAALRGGPSPARAAEDETSEIAELLDGHGRDADWIFRLQALTAAALPKERKGDLVEARARLKGWIENETSESPD